MTQIKQRAVNPEQKQQRVEQILDAAQARFVDTNFSQIRLSDIAQDIGITKAAFYRYFRKKELLFLQLYLRHLEQLTVSIQQNLSEQNLKQQNLSGQQLVPALSKACQDNVLFCKLSAILHSVLEENISSEEAVVFKRAIKEKMSLSLNQFIPLLKVEPEQAIELFLMMHQVIIGAWAMCNPSGEVKLVLTQNDDLALFNKPFDEMISKHLTLLFSPYVS